MSQTDAAATEQRTAQPRGEPEPLSENVPSVMPIVVGPAIVIGIAALAGYLAGVVGYRNDDLATLAIGTVVAAVLIGVIVHRIQPRKRTWLVAVIVTVASLAMFSLGVAKLREGQQVPSTSPESRPLQTPTAASSPVHAGYRFRQEDIRKEFDFRGADLRGAQLVRLDLRGIDFSGANAAGASFDGSRLDRAVFRGADLGGAVLSRTCLNHAILRGADLTGVTAIDADVSNADIDGEASVAASWPQTSAQSTACK